ncbi:MAG: hypothetical protein AAFQ37_12100, partial [Bacteroidota bacterium]
MGRKHRRAGKLGKVNATEASPLSPAVSSRYRFFRWLCAFFFLAALFIRIDVITIWPGAEAMTFSQAMGFEKGSYLPAWITYALLEPGARLYPSSDLFFFYPRILSGFLMVSAAFLYYQWGSRLF